MPDRQSNPCPLAALLDDVQRGLESAYEELYRQTHTRLTGVAVRVVRSPELAAEVVQEVYLEIWQQCARFDRRRGSAWGWMGTIVHRRAVDRVRSVSRAARLDQRWGLGELDLELRDPSEDVVARLDAARVRVALARLPRLQQQALLLTYGSDRSATDAATLLGVPLPTLKSRMHAGRRSLQHALGDTQRQVVGTGADRAD